MTIDSRGFTLVELMITVVIVGILAAIAYPSYQNYVIQTRRSDAHIALTRAANLQERFMTECNRYATTLEGTRNCGGGVLGMAASAPIRSPDGHYVLSLVTANTSSTAFEIMANPADAAASQRQGNDGRFWINSIGQKFWDRNNDGDHADAREDTWAK